MPSKAVASKGPSRGVVPKAAKGGVAGTRRHPPAVSPVTNGRFSMDDSKFVRSVWVWRTFLGLAMVALGVAIIFAGNGKGTIAILWVVIAVGWAAFAMGLWRRHMKLVR